MGLRELLRGWFLRPEGARTDNAGGLLSSAPDVSEADRWCLEGAEHLTRGRLAEAEQALARALECRHDYAEALLFQGAVFIKQKRLEEAIDSLVLASHFKPDLAEAHHQLGAIAKTQGRADEAEKCFRRALEVEPSHARAHNDLGALLSERGAVDEAVRCFRSAVALNPEFAAAHTNLGCLLTTRLDEFAEGARHIEAAWRLAPDVPDVRCNWAVLLQYRGQLTEALAIFDQLIAEDSNADLSRLNRSLALLKLGDYARGWIDYEARKRVAWDYVPRELPFPEWQGEMLSGRTIAVCAEQGLGDQIMFASCIPDLEKLAGHCVLECAPKLERLFRRSFPTATVTSETISGESLNRLPKLDFHVATGSLPLHFRRSIDEFPRRPGYLRGDPDAIARWRQRLGALPGRHKVGISWRGGMKSTRQSVRSIMLEQWIPILRREDISFISLQYTDCRDELEALEREHGIRIHHWPEAIDDYDQTAALVCALDLVISVQTAIVHLGGALGTPVWVMVPAVAEWRYLQSGERLPWYPAVRLFRQTSPGEWEPVIDQIALALSELAFRNDEVRDGGT